MTRSIVTLTTKEGKFSAAHIMEHAGTDNFEVLVSVELIFSTFSLLFS